MVDVKKALHAVPDPASNSAPSLTPEDIFKFSMTSTTSENVLQSTIPIKGNDQDGMTTEAEINVIQEKTRPEVQVLHNIYSQLGFQQIYCCFISTVHFNF